MKCEIPCDYCGNTPAIWFQNTSVAVCTRKECVDRNWKNWVEHCAAIDRECKRETGYMEDLE